MALAVDGLFLFGIHCELCTILGEAAAASRLYDRDSTHDSTALGARLERPSRAAFGVQRMP